MERCCGFPATDTARTRQRLYNRVSSSKYQKSSQQEITMTKAELIEDVSRVVEMSRKDSEIIV